MNDALGSGDRMRSFVVGVVTAFVLAVLVVVAHGGLSAMGSSGEGSSRSCRCSPGTSAAP